jgi:hypothetical protein
MPCVPFSVEIKIQTPDGLREINLELAKTCVPEESWTIQFELWERESVAAAFQIVGSISLPIDPEDHPGAQTIADEGLCVAQRGQALIAADTVKAMQQGFASRADLEEAVKQIVRA